MSNRNYKSFYYDRYTGRVDNATSFIFNCKARPYRFVLVFVGYVKPPFCKIEKILNDLGINTGLGTRYFRLYKTKMPF